MIRIPEVIRWPEPNELAAYADEYNTIGRLNIIFLQLPYNFKGTKIYYLLQLQIFSQCNWSHRWCSFGNQINRGKKEETSILLLETILLNSFTGLSFTKSNYFFEREKLLDYVRIIQIHYLSRLLQHMTCGFLMYLLDGLVEPMMHEYSAWILYSLLCLDVSGTDTLTDCRKRTTSWEIQPFQWVHK